MNSNNATYNHALGSIYWKDLNGTYIGCNDFAAQKAGFETSEQIIGKTDYDLFPKKEADLYRKNDLEVIKTGKELVKEEIMRLPDGNKAVQLSSKKPLKDKNGKIIGIIGNTVDITYLKKMEEELIKAKKQEELANKSKSCFLTTIERIIRDPLNAILGAAQILKIKQASSEQKQLSNIVFDSAQTITPMLDRMRYYLDLETGELTCTVYKFELKSFIDFQLKKHHEAIKNKGLKLTFNYDPILPAWIYSDRHYLSVILNNLLSNAIKYTAKGSITLDVRKQTSKNSPVHLEIRVSDTGQGIKPEAQRLLFHLFKQEWIEESRYEFTNPGVNLSISAKLMEILGGTIDVESKVGKGSTFTIKLPLQKAEQPKRTYMQSSLEKPQPKKEKPSTKKPLDTTIRILGIDDDPMSQRVAELMLSEKFKCEFESVYFLSDAIKRINNDYDLILLDMNLPDGEGTTFLKELKKKRGKNHAPVIAITAFTGEEEWLAMEEAGAVNIIHKPVDMKRFLKLVERYVFENGEDV